MHQTENNALSAMTHLCKSVWQNKLIPAQTEKFMFKLSTNKSVDLNRARKSKCEICYMQKSCLHPWVKSESI